MPGQKALLWLFWYHLIGVCVCSSAEGSCWPSCWLFPLSSSLRLSCDLSLFLCLLLHSLTPLMIRPWTYSGVWIQREMCSYYIKRTEIELLFDIMLLDPFGFNVAVFTLRVIIVFCFHFFIFKKMWDLRMTMTNLIESVWATRPRLYPCPCHNLAYHLQCMGVAHLCSTLWSSADS